MENQQKNSMEKEAELSAPRSQNGEARPRPKKNRGSGKKNRIDFRYQPAGSEASLSTPLSQMGLREATLDALEKGGVKTARDLAIRKERDLYRIQNIGKKNILDAKRALERLQLSFRPDEEEKREEKAPALSAREKLERSLNGRKGKEESGARERFDQTGQRRNEERRGNRFEAEGGRKERNNRREAAFDNARTGQQQQPKAKSAKARAREKELERARRFAEFKKKLYTEPPQEKAPPERGQLVRICKNSKWGFVDKKGMEVVSPVYDEVFNFREGMAGVEKNGAIGYVNELGEEVVAPKYECGLSYSDGLASVTQDGKCGYIDKEGNVVIDFLYDAATSFFEGSAKVRQAGKWGTIQKDGSVEWIK